MSLPSIIPNVKTPSSLITEDLIFRWLQLNNVPKMGFFRLSRAASTLACDLSELANVSESDLTSAGFSKEQINAISPKNKTVIKHFKQACNWLDKHGNRHFISLNCPSFPLLLKTIDSPPLFLFAHGDCKLMQVPQLAIVGSRAPSLYAKKVTYELVQALAKQTSVITTSGMALGIDAACHKASLANGLPTIGVLGCGIDVVYPKRHTSLYEEVRATGLLLSEFLPNAQPAPNMFPRRNRIISGMSAGTLVIEAKIKSGSLVTAKCALEQNREVFAIPNNINNPNAGGCHWLIKQGAKLVESVDDIIAELPSIAVASANTSLSEKNKKNQLECLASDPLLDSVDYSATPVDAIAKRTGMSLSDVLSQLLEYELRGIVASSAQGYIKLRG